jgi:hypothetical protein
MVNPGLPIVNTSAPTAWDFSQDLGNLGVDLGFGDFAMKSWDFLLLLRKNLTCHFDIFTVVNLEIMEF